MQSHGVPLKSRGPWGDEFPLLQATGITPSRAIYVCHCFSSRENKNKTINIKLKKTKHILLSWWFFGAVRVISVKLFQLLTSSCRMWPGKKRKVRNFVAFAPPFLAKRLCWWISEVWRKVVALSRLKPQTFGTLPNDIVENLEEWNRDTRPNHRLCQKRRSHGSASSKHGIERAKVFQLNRKR